MAAGPATLSAGAVQGKGLQAPQRSQASPDSTGEPRRTAGAPFQRQGALSSDKAAPVSLAGLPCAKGPAKGRQGATLTAAATCRRRGRGKAAPCQSAETRSMSSWRTPPWRLRRASGQRPSGKDSTRQEGPASSWAWREPAAPDWRARPRPVWHNAGMAERRQPDRPGTRLGRGRTACTRAPFPRACSRRRRTARFCHGPGHGGKAGDSLAEAGLQACDSAGFGARQGYFGIFQLFPCLSPRLPTESVKIIPEL